MSDDPNKKIVIRPDDLRGDQHNKIVIRPDELKPTGPPDGPIPLMWSPAEQTPLPPSPSVSSLPPPPSVASLPSTSPQAHPPSPQPIPRGLLFLGLGVLVIVVIAGATLFFSPTRQASSKNYAPAIEAVLTQAEKASIEAARTHKSLSVSKTLTKMIDAYYAIDIRDCPPEFQSAFLSYITAIESIIPFSKKYDDVSFYSVFASASELVTLGPGRLREVVEEGKRLKQDLLAARQKVREVGLRYGAKVTEDF